MTGQSYPCHLVKIDSPIHSIKHGQKMECEIFSSIFSDSIVPLYKNMIKYIGMLKYYQYTPYSEKRNAMKKNIETICGEDIVKTFNKTKSNRSICCGGSLCILLKMILDYNIPLEEKMIISIMLFYRYDSEIPCGARHRMYLLMNRRIKLVRKIDRWYTWAYYLPPSMYPEIFERCDVDGILLAYNRGCFREKNFIAGFVDENKKHLSVLQKVTNVTYTAMMDVDRRWQGYCTWEVFVYHVAMCYVLSIMGRKNKNYQVAKYFAAIRVNGLKHEWYKNIIRCTDDEIQDEIKKMTFD